MNYKESVETKFNAVQIPLESPLFLSNPLKYTVKQQKIYHNTFFVHIFVTQGDKCIMQINATFYYRRRIPHNQWTAFKITHKTGKFIFWLPEDQQLFAQLCAA